MKDSVAVEKILSCLPKDRRSTSPKTVVRRVLFASDCSDHYEDCQKMLSERGVEVRRVHDGRSCLNEALLGKECGTPFDIIVLAVDLPVLDGFSTAMLLRENDCARIIISIDGTDHYLQVEESQGAGCDMHSQLNTLQHDLESLLN